MLLAFTVAIISDISMIQWPCSLRYTLSLWHFLGAGEDEYTFQSLRLFLLGAIHRAFSPGLKFAVFIVIVQLPQVIGEPLVFDCQQAEEGGLPGSLPAHQTCPGLFKRPDMGRNRTDTLLPASLSGSR